MAKFTKLNIGESVASSGSRAWKKLSVESAEVQDELAGTWVFEDTIDLTSYPYTERVGKMHANPLNFTCNGATYSYLTKITSPVSLRYQNSLVLPDGDMTYYKGEWWDESYKTINITTLFDDVTNGDEVLTWLQANATKIA